MKKTNVLLRIIKTYPKIAIILIMALFPGIVFILSVGLGAHWLKNSQMVINTPNEKMAYLDNFSNVIIGDEIKIEKKDGDRWPSGKVANYIFVVSGEQRFSIVVDIMANNKCVNCIHIENDNETVILYIDDNDAMCFFDYCQKYAK